MAEKIINYTHFVHGLDQVPEHAEGISGPAKEIRDRYAWETSAFSVMPEIVVDGGNQAEQELTGPWATVAIEAEDFAQTLGYSLAWLSSLHNEALAGIDKNERTALPSLDLTNYEEIPSSHEQFWWGLAKSSGRILTDPGRQDKSISPFIRSVMRGGWRSKDPATSISGGWGIDDPRTGYEYGLTTSRGYLMLNGMPLEGQVPMSELRKGPEMYSAYADFLYSTYHLARELFPKGSKEQETADNRWRSALATLENVWIDLVKEKGREKLTFTDLRAEWGSRMSTRFQIFLERNPALVEEAHDNLDRSIVKYMKEQGLSALVAGDQTGAAFEWDGSLKNIFVQSTLNGHYTAPEKLDSYAILRPTPDNAQFQRWQAIEGMLKYPDEHRMAYNRALVDMHAPQHKLRDHETLILINSATGRFAIQQRRSPNNHHDWQLAVVPKNQKDPATDWIDVGSDISMSTLVQFMQSPQIQQMIGDHPSVWPRAIAALPAFAFFHEGTLSGICIQNRGSSYKGISKKYVQYQREIVSDEQYQLPTIHVPGPRFDFWGNLARVHPDTVIKLSQPWVNFLGADRKTAKEFGQVYEQQRLAAKTMRERLDEIAAQGRQHISRDVLAFGLDETIVMAVNNVSSAAKEVRGDLAFVHRVIADCQNILREQMASKQEIKAEGSGEDEMKKRQGNLFTEDALRAILIAVNANIIRTMNTQTQFLKDSDKFPTYLGYQPASQVADDYIDAVDNYKSVAQQRDQIERAVSEANRSIRQMYERTYLYDIEILTAILRNGEIAKYKIDVDGTLNDVSSKFRDDENKYAVFAGVLEMVRKQIFSRQESTFYDEYVQARHPSAYVDYQTIRNLSPLVHSSKFQESLAQVAVRIPGDGRGKRSVEKTVLDQFNSLIRLDSLIGEEEAKGEDSELLKLSRLRESRVTFASSLAQFPDWEQQYSMYRFYHEAARNNSQFLKEFSVAQTRREYNDHAAADYRYITVTFGNEREKLRVKDQAYNAYQKRVEELSIAASRLAENLGRADGDQPRGLRKKYLDLGRKIDELHEGAELREWMYRTGTVLAHVAADLHDVSTADWGNTRASAFTAWLVGGEEFLLKLATSGQWIYDEVY